MKTLITFFLLALALFFLPYILSTSFGAPLVAAVVSKKIGAPLEIEKVSLSWLGPQTLTNVTFPHGFSLKEVQSEASLFSLMTSSETKVRGSDGVFAGDPTTTLERVEVEKGRDLKIFGTTRSQGKNGSFTIEGDKTWKASFQDVPSRLVESYFPKFPISGVLGPLFTLDFYLQEDKEMRLAIASPIFRFSTKGRLAGETFYPTEETYIAGVLQETLSQKLFQKSSVRPVSASHIELRISPDGARLPLDWQEMQIPKAELSLNKIIFRNFGTLSDLISVVELRVRPNQDVMIWFQKAPISFYQGKLTLQARTELLVDNKYELGLWGDVDLKKEKAHLTLGLTQDVLAKVFGLDNVPRGYTIPMKLDGPFSDIHLHKSHALKQIAALFLLQQSRLPLVWPEEKTPQSRPPYPWYAR